MNEKNEKRSDEEMVQKIIDPTTGEDITGEYINERLEELKNEAKEIILSAFKRYQEHPEEKKAIYEKTHWKIHDRLGMGSIGPATAAAGPLMDEMKKKLAEKLAIPEEEILP